MSKIAFFLLVGLVLAACSDSHTPPAGRWIGHYETEGIMVDTRLEVLPDGRVRASAPNILDAGDVSEEDRAMMHARLALELVSDWDNVEARQLDFDGRTFRKPGGVAPQMEWNPHTKQMKLVFYFGKRQSLRIALQAVQDFNEDSWIPK